ncbi:MAG TPA: hypothetical protein VF316_08265 [Polyangiaceae bacterium]
MRARLLGASAATLLVMGAACSANDDPQVHLAPSLVFPKGLLDTVSRVSVKVYDATTGVDCDATKGTVKGLTNQAPLASKDLGTTGCASGAKFCGDVQLEKSGDGRVFAAEAFTLGNTTPVASGCTKATVNQDTLQVQITMLRFVPPSLCGGKSSPVPVQCTDPGAVDDLVCGTDCLSKEIYLSKGDGTAGSTGDVKQKAKPAFLWPAAKLDAGRFVGFWGDRSPSGRTQVAMRVMADDLRPYTAQGPGVEGASFFLPNDASGSFPPGGEAGSQFNPTAAAASNAVYVAYEDNQNGPVAISLRSLDQTLVRSDQPAAGPIKISDPAGTAQTNPSMALSGAKLFIAWENGASVVGRGVATSGFTKDAQKSLGSGKSPVVVGTSTGWVVVYQGGSDIKLLPIDASGTPGAEVKVNDGTHTGTQEHPGVAVLPDGKIAVVWSDTGAQGGAGIFVQRFSAALAPVANDQSVRINDVTLGAQATPAIAAGSNFFVAAWVDTASGHVRARLLDGTNGFLFNSVNGQSSDFQASVIDGHTRTSPAVVVGGAAPYIAIGWEDDTGSPASYAGVFARRFPTP